ncbi:hypothetical protein KUTeg_005480 [Tegillarca granosa]|uniref:Uncharacterized protein n=1 Tax=Tegillarca granosa TaxID=220873 RepID=A0ABQ9FN41_TEGGR|nr:hypothetical protein KUTeg_005480 [Tegillarca granosa]
MFKNKLDKQDEIFLDSSAGGLCIIAVVQLSSSLPVTQERWENPCGGTDSSTDEQLSDFPFFFESVTEPVDEILQRTFRNIQEGQSLAENVVYRIFNESIQNHHNKAVLDTIHFDGFPTSSALPESESTREVNLIAYNKLKKAAVFIEETRSDEESSDTPVFKDAMKSNEDKLYTIMCNLEKAIEGDGGNVTGTVSRDIMSDYLRNMGSTADRRERDYIIYKDFNLLYKSFIVYYSKFDN